MQLKEHDHAQLKSTKKPKRRPTTNFSLDGNVVRIVINYSFYAPLKYPNEDSAYHIRNFVLVHLERDETAGQSQSPLMALSRSPLAGYLVLLPLVYHAVAIILVVLILEY